MNFQIPLDEVVQTTNGPVRGVLSQELGIWKGIRYAQAPVGDLRFKAPQPPIPWIEPADATTFGPASHQTSFAAAPLGEGVAVSEDSLSINVWTPLTGEPGKPVMVWVHGGAYCKGAASQPVFDGTRLAQDGDVVFVSLNYRLGVLGFTDFRSFAPDDDSFVANAGLLDVIAALQWVRDNIERFGGDPQRVTLFGQSAGGGIITTLMTVPAAEGLFQQAIVQSSPATSVYNTERAAQIAGEFLDRLGVEPAAIDQLKKIDVETLVRVSDELYSAIPEAHPGILAFSPIKDDVLVPEYPLLAFQQGTAHRIPLVIGTNRDEATAFTKMKSPLMPVDPQIISEMFDEIGAEHPEETLPTEDDVSVAYTKVPAKRVGMSISGDFGFRMPAIWIVEAHSRYAPTWLYRFDYSTPMLKLAKIGAAHSVELSYVFGNLPQPKNHLERALSERKKGERISERVRSRWTNFAHFGIPESAESDVLWPHYEAPRRSSLIINVKDSTRDDFDHPLREAWGDEVLSFT